MCPQYWGWEDEFALREFELFFVVLFVFRSPGGCLEGVLRGEDGALEPDRLSANPPSAALSLWKTLLNMSDLWYLISSIKAMCVFLIDLLQGLSNGIHVTCLALNRFPTNVLMLFWNGESCKDLLFCIQPVRHRRAMLEVGGASRKRRGAQKPCCNLWTFRM